MRRGAECPPFAGPYLTADSLQAGVAAVEDGQTGPDPNRRPSIPVRTHSHSIVEKSAYPGILKEKTTPVLYEVADHSPQR